MSGGKLCQGKNHADKNNFPLQDDLEQKSVSGHNFTDQSGFKPHLVAQIIVTGSLI